MKTLFLAWQDPESRKFFPIGKLTFSDNYYQFVYIKGALAAKEQSNFQELISFPSLEKVYQSQELFPLFSNRLLPRSRPEYKDFIKWMSVSQDDADPIALLARSGGKKMTDTLEIFPYPEPDKEGIYHIHFFVHGISHLTESSINRIEQLQPSEQLLLVKDIQNPKDRNAILLRTSENTPGDMHLLGYLPCYLAEDISKILEETSVYVSVERINPSPAPLQFRLLCSINFTSLNNLCLFANQIYQPIVNEISQSISA